MHDLVVKHTRLMCRHPLLSVPVSYGGSSLAPDGQPLRGIVDLADAIVEDVYGASHEAQHESVQLPTVDVPTMAEHTAITVDGVAKRVRSFRRIDDGAITRVFLVDAA